MRRLDHDLNRFTIELEADTGGITEILEQSEPTLFNKYKQYTYLYILVANNNAVVNVCFAIVHLAHVGSYLLDRPPSPERRPVGQSEQYLCTCISVQFVYYDILLHQQSYT